MNLARNHRIHNKGGRVKPTNVKYVAAMLVLSIAVFQPCAYAASMPSKTARDQALASRDSDLVLDRMRYATDRLATALAAEGLDPAQVETRLAALATADVVSFGRNPEQIRSAGISMSKRMWTAVG